MSEPATHPCKVCQTLDGDHTPKATAKYCGMCGTYICEPCGGNWLRRGMAKAIIETSAKRRRELAEERKAHREGKGV
jgi:Zn-finger nucleic acid-binding protein